MTFLLILLGLKLLSCVRGQNNCCLNNGTIDVDSQCSGLDRINLNCTDGTVFLLDRTEKEEDDFYVNETNLIFEDGIQIAPSDYCIGYYAEPQNETAHVVALVCIRNERKLLENLDNTFVIVIFVILEFASIGLMILALMVYVILPQMRDLQGHCVLHFLLNYSVVYFIINLLQYSGYTFCFSKAYSFYFFTISSFCWLCVVLFNLWKSFLYWDINFWKMYVFYILYGYGLPLILLLLISLIQYYPGDHPKPDFYEGNCWFREHKSTWWYFYSPIAFILIVMVVLIGDSFRRLRKMYLNPLRNPQKTGILRLRLCLCTKLFIIVAITWLFGIVTSDIFREIAALLLITDILNSLQGILIFAVLIATRKKVLKLLGNCKPCGLRCFPTSWKSIYDIESEEDYYQKQNELFNTSLKE